jgi:cytochrome b6-f complex iron-sulfur subunit
MSTEKPENGKGSPSAPEPAKKADKPAAAKKAAATKPAKKAAKAKPVPEVRDGRAVAGGVIAPKGTKFNKEEIIAQALEKIRTQKSYAEAQKPSAETTRRGFFAMIGWAGQALFAGFLALATARFFFPRVLFEAPTKFKAGSPTEYAIGEVSDKYKASNRVWIVREPGGFYVVFARCTHLGCTPLWLEGEQKFKCPCHGSEYTKEAINYEGPAPRPMERCHLDIGPDGQLVIDTGKRYVYQGGPGKGWETNGAYLNYTG